MIVFSNNFSNPEFLYIGFVLSILITYFSWIRTPKRLLSLFNFVGNENRLLNNLKILVLFSIQFISLIILSISASGPFLTKTVKNKEREVRDIFFVVDVSRSMLADDFVPNRLEVAKSYIRKFIQLRSDDRIGLNIFAEKIITLAPLTFDQDTINKKVDDINVGFLGNGTNIGDSIALAVARLVASESKSKIIILLTDGVSNVGSISPIHAGEIAKEKNVKIYGIGIGSEGDAYIPYKVGTNTLKQRIPGGNIDHETLSKISSYTNGKYYKAINEKSLNNIFQEINKLEKSKVIINDPVLIKYEYRKYLYIGLIIFLITEILRRYFFRFAL